MTTVQSIPGQVDLCSSGTDRTLCCTDDIGLTNCNWYGDPANLYGQWLSTWTDGHLSTLMIRVMELPPVSAAILAVTVAIHRMLQHFLPFPWVMFSRPQRRAVKLSPLPQVFLASYLRPLAFIPWLQVDYDDNEGTPDDTTAGAGSSSILSDDGNENTSPFSSVFISSPNAASVSSLDLESDWVVTDCDATSDQPQTVNAYCTCQIDDEDCGCGHVFIGQTADTIVKMPSSCGLGPYARVTSLEVHPDQTVLSAEHMARKRGTEPVYSLSFDYAFTDISEDNGPIYMRADMTDIQGYWDSIIDSPPEAGSPAPGTTSVKRDLNFHQPQGYQPRSLEKRWFGSFSSWLAKLNTLTSSNSLSRNYHWSDTYTIFHQEESCPNFQSSLDISVTGFASIDSQFGYYLEATVVPPAVQQAYVYFKAGFYYPGLLTLGPSLNFYGELSGQISLSGTYQTTVAYTFPSLDLSFGKQDSDAGQSNLGAPVSPTSNSNSMSYSIGYNVELSGSVDVHLIPSLQLGVSVLGGTLIDAQVFVEADMFAGLSITGSVSQAVAPEFCITTNFGVSLNAGLTGSLLYWQTGPISTTFYSIQSDSEPGCFDSVTESADGSTRKRLLLEPAVDTTRVTSDSFSAGHNRRFESRTIASKSQPAHAVTHDGWTIYPTSRWERKGLWESSTVGSRNRRDVPLLSGSLFCPSVNSNITASSINCDPYAGDATPLSRRDILEEESLDRRGDDTGDKFWTAQLSGLAQDFQAFPIAAYTSLALNGFYDLNSPATMSGAIQAWTPGPPYYTATTANGQPSLGGATNGVAVYGREHVYEQSMSSLFIDYLHQFSDVWTDGSGDSFCQWIDNNLWSVPAYMPAGSTPVATQIGKCYPSLANSRAAGIPVLEQRANEYKQSAFYVTQQSLDQAVLTTAPGIVSSDTFRNQCPTAQVATLRSLAMITPFMNSLPARNQFLQTHNCIGGVYQIWYTAYEAAATARGVTTLPTAAMFVAEYNSWVRQIVMGIQGAVTLQMNTLIPLFNGGNSVGVDVKLSTNSVLSAWAKLNPPVAANVAWAPTNNQASSLLCKNSRTEITILKNTAMTSANLISITNVAPADLTTLRNKSRVPAINWVAMLP
ncbi:Chitin-binding type-1 domain-containing protein [Mycena sanguinolenta]|uniref:Chitin-binding type-1 domain-containing protein n=1 Tax=Mycena sanguinolenta TaxID=230812 RepID=A0A8H7DGV7_9AGAR|nr:Chitin-binding type-1 domain-containing protein [Mycena sanguinolenta]